ncbi:MAG: SLC13 family permease [Gammaproteobacteria bacterium]|nr:SLC13 family permease [Gammaproteobacteria bacterium]
MVPALPEWHALVTLGLAVLSLILFSQDKIRLESSALLVLTCLVLFFYLFPLAHDPSLLQPQFFFLAFGNEALITIVSLMICAKALEHTGALQSMARLIATAWISRPRMALLATLTLSAVLSMFMNNTPLVAMLLPLLVGVAIRSNFQASELLLPAGYATILGGMCTVMGTSSNIIVANLALDMGMPRFGLLDFFVPSSIAAGAGLLFLWLFGSRLLPARKAPLETTEPRFFHGVLHLVAKGPADGKTVAEVLSMARGPLHLREIERGEGLMVAKLPTLKLKAGDRLHVRGAPSRLRELETLLGATLYAEQDEEEATDKPGPRRPEEQQIAEIVVTANSPLHGRKISGNAFFRQNNLLPLALHRKGRSPGETLESQRNVALEVGDVLLVQGRKEAIRQLKVSGILLLLDGALDAPMAERRNMVIAIILGVVVVAAVGLMPISVCSLAGAGLIIANKCLTREQLRSALDTRLIMVVVASLALGNAIAYTGGARYLAELFSSQTHSLAPAAIISLLILSVALITELVTNSAVAAMGTPIAFAIAKSLGMPPEPFVLAVMFGANMSYLTPAGYQVNMMVMSAGGYRASDFLRLGIPLQLVVWVTLSLSMAWYYELAW